MPALYLYLIALMMATTHPTRMNKIIVFDLETTGLYPELGDMIIEIAAVPILDGKIDIDKSFETLVNPGKKIPPYITQINHITDEMVKGAPPIEVALPGFLDFIQDSPLVAHNAPFDRGFLSFFIKRLGLKTLNNKIIDTLTLSKTVFKRSRYHNMDAVLRRLGIPYNNEKRHRSREDAYFTALAYLKLKSMR